MRIRENIEKRPKLQSHLTGARTEVEGWYIDPDSGMLVTFHLDMIKDFERPIGQYHGIIGDLKKTKSANPRTFARVALPTYHLQIQAAMYVRALWIITGKKYIFAWILVEEGSPYIVTGAIANPSVIEIGTTQAVKGMLALLDCMKTGHWPGYVEDLTDISFPTWYEQMIEFEGMGDSSI